MSIIEAVIIAIVEGLTEFLPVSSTGHMVIAETLLGTKGDFVKLFTVAIQLGAILAVVVLYWKKFFDFSRWQFYIKLIIGVLPALLLGFLFSDKIDVLLESPKLVAITLVIGGIFLLFIDRLFNNPITESDGQISYFKSFIIGCWQVLALIPGVSRSAATIIGGMQQTLTRKVAAEVSFFLAVPTMFAAFAYFFFIKTWSANGLPQKGYEIMLSSSQNIYAFIVGNVVAFAVATIAIKFFINYLKKYGFRIFGIYRIVVGLLIIAILSVKPF
ncbi:MAG: undecaprenyl-diphosphate phosphatase [Chitinophagaceae bacterium]|nr:undecaprenyl-diphosphate phosphatase [Chitinophagaceae bacterium]